MRGLIITAAAVVLLSAGGAQAQSLSLDATGQGSGHITVDTKSKDYGIGQYTLTKGREGGSTEALYTINAQTISFESGVAVSGGFAQATSYSGVDITLFNNSDGLLAVENFGSTIIPAGMGFYLQDRAPPVPGVLRNVFTDNGETTELFTLSDLDPSMGSEIAYSDFEFSVVSNDMTLYSLSGWLSLTVDGQGNLQRNFGLDAASAALMGFTNTGHDQDISWAYAWDETHIVLPLNALLETGQSQVIQYRTRVTSRTRAECLSSRTCLVAFSGFGDPIGRGGGVAAEFDMVAFRGFNMQMEPEIEPITGIVFSPEQIAPFRLLPNNGGLVPEPSTWLMMIFGFGLLGATLRRQRVVTYS